MTGIRVSSSATCPVQLENSAAMQEQPLRLCASPSPFHGNRGLLVSGHSSGSNRAAPASFVEFSQPRSTRLGLRQNAGKPSQAPFRRRLSALRRSRAPLQWTRFWCMNTPLVDFGLIQQLHRDKRPSRNQGGPIVSEGLGGRARCDFGQVCMHLLHWLVL